MSFLSRSILSLLKRNITCLRQFSYGDVIKLHFQQFAYIWEINFDKDLHNCALIAGDKKVIGHHSSLGRFLKVLTGKHYALKLLDNIGQGAPLSLWGEY